MEQPLDKSRGLNRRKGAVGMRRPIAALLLAIAGFLQPEVAGSAEIAVRVTVLTFARVETFSALESVHLSPAQAQARQLTVPGAVSAAVVSSGSSYGLDLEILDPLVAQVEVEGLGRRMVVGPAGHRERFSAARGRSTVTLTYVVTYREGVTAGQRPAPLSVRFDLS